MERPSTSSITDLIKSRSRRATSSSQLSWQKPEAPSRHDQYQRCMTHTYTHTCAYTSAYHNKTICFLTPNVGHHQYHQKSSSSACIDRPVRYSIGGCIHWGSLLCHGVLRRYIIILFVVLQNRERRKKTGTKMKYIAIYV
jgi:hypothetical protein